MSTFVVWVLLFTPTEIPQMHGESVFVAVLNTADECETERRQLQADANAKPQREGPGVWTCQREVVLK
jgi:hypothetical protein